MLTRIYGTAYTKKADLDAHLEHLEEIKKRDHNKLGRELELFTTVDVIGQGLPLIMPNGVKAIQKHAEMDRRRGNTPRLYENQDTADGQIRSVQASPATGIITKKVCSYWETRKKTKKYLPCVQ